jgi:hypothetical protein
VDLPDRLQAGDTQRQVSTFIWIHRDKRSKFGRSISSGHRPVEAILSPLMRTEGLPKEVVSVILQHPSDPLDPVVKHEFQFRPLNFLKECLNARKKIVWLVEMLSR